MGHNDLRAVGRRAPAAETLSPVTMVKRAYRLQVRRGPRRRVALLLARFETRRGSFVGTPASRARDHSPDPSIPFPALFPPPRRSSPRTLAR